MTERVPTASDIETDGFTRGRARSQLRECCECFRRDGLLDKERSDILEALDDFDFPASADEYVAFCHEVLCWVPWEFRK